MDKSLFCEEDGRWKIALDKLIDDVKKAQETQPTIENTNSVNANSTNTTKRD